MSVTTGIEWTDATWNPVRGCDKISPGCKHCYASTFSERFRGVPGHPFEQGFDLRLVPEKLNEPLKWKKPRRIFVNSMSDLFHRQIPVSYLREVCDVMMEATHHTYQVLTKRSDYLKDVLLSDYFADMPNAKHVWWGVSVEDKKYGLPRIEDLRRSQTRNAFLSIEPLLEDLGTLSLDGIRWVIVGGESGPGARPMHPDWARSLRDQCVGAGVPFFMKQMGSVYGPNKGHNLPDDLNVKEFPSA